MIAWYQCQNRNCPNCQEKVEFSVVIEDKTSVNRCWKCQSSNVRFIRKEFEKKQRRKTETPNEQREREMAIQPGMEDL